MEFFVPRSPYSHPNLSSKFQNPNDEIRASVTGRNSNNLIHWCFIYSSSEVLLIRGIFWGPGNRCWYLSFDGWKRSNRTLFSSSNRIDWCGPSPPAAAPFRRKVCATCSLCLVLLDRILKAQQQIIIIYLCVSIARSHPNIIQTYDSQS